VQVLSSHRAGVSHGEAGAGQELEKLAQTDGTMAAMEVTEDSRRFVRGSGELDDKHPAARLDDAPALAAADVGIAMGSGTDIAMESAQVTLVKGELTAILRARALSRATVRNIRQNLFFAFVYSSIGIPVAAGALYPFFGVLLSPALAAAAMSLSSVSVVSNALRLRRVTLR
jgi:hypothetical protein